MTLPGFSFGGAHTNDFGLYLVQKQIELVPESRDIEQVIYGRPGVYDYRTEYDKRYVSVTLATVGDTRADLLSALHAFAASIDPSKGYQQLIFDDEPDKYYLAKYTSTGNGAQQPFLTFQKLIGQVQIGFKCADPFIYSTTPQRIEWEAPYQGQTVLTNNGTASCPVKITIQSPATSSTEFEASGLGATSLGAAGGASQTAGVTLTISGVPVTYTGNIGPGDTVAIDTGNYTVTLNGQNALQYWQGDFPQLSPGANTVTEFDTMGAGAAVTFDYTERWL
ncbi:hypothetical protein GCM10025857_06720 [Alicyclobacillus contaminans]|uniref:distal tail protein Dit n=1 Tax=Alicyclobacillus contaminans TaxID=392016 RepID=UPI0003F614FB|nr:distal tail protein Dit [Alicyclobacillus contaminans]GMA49315.1 hypothetical protein GCM10025857_06720 [Alicyclobacillus contaminans]